MRHLVPAALIAATLAILGTAGAAFAGGTSDGLDCPNHCPLAKSANTLRTNGSEATASSTVVTQDVRREVLVGLARI